MLQENTSLAATAWSRQANVSPSEKPDKYRNMLGKSTMNVSDVVNTTHEVAKRSKATKERTKQLAAFVPDFILSDEGQKIPYISSYEAVVLMADVSGFITILFIIIIILCIYLCKQTNSYSSLFRIYCFN